MNKIGSNHHKRYIYFQTIWISIHESGPKYYKRFLIDCNLVVGNKHDSPNIDNAYIVLTT